MNMEEIVLRPGMQIWLRRGERIGLLMRRIVEKLAVREGHGSPIRHPAPTVG